MDTHADAVAASDGAGATDRVDLTHVNGSLAMPRVYFTESSDRGATWASPRAIETAGDRGFYTAPAISPDGTDVYVVYNAFTTPSCTGARPGPARVQRERAHRRVPGRLRLRRGHSRLWRGRVERHPQRG